jgi:hypothetical protein
MRRVGWIVVLLGIVGCQSSDNGRTTNIVNRPMTANDTPFGGGFPASQKPNGDPFGRAGSRNVIQPHYGADNGAPETRVGSNGDTRLSR